MAHDPDAGAGPGAPLDGRLDLDHLDGVTDLGGLEVLPDDSPGLREALARRLEDSGALPFVRRHRTAVVAAATAGAVAVAGLAAYALTRPAPMPERPAVAVRAAGTDPTASVQVDVTTGRFTAVAQNLTVASEEPEGVTVALVRLAGPGLAPSGGAAIGIAAGHEDPYLTVPGQLACDDEASATSAVSSTPDDFGVVVRRTSAEGETRDDVVPLAGAATLAGLVQRACLERAVVRDLRVGAVQVDPVPGVVAVDLDLELTNVSQRRWSGVQIAAAAQPVVTNDGRAVELEPGTSGHLHARLWPQDCADPAASLRAGLLLSTDLGPSGRAPGAVDTHPSVPLALPAAALDAVAGAAQAQCGYEIPRAEVVRARLREGSQDGSGGVIDLVLRMTTPGAGLVEVDHLGDGSLALGELFAYESPVHAVDGAADVKAQWRLPACGVLVSEGLPRLHVVLAGEVRRPYLVRLKGDALAPVLFRLCGPEVSQRA